MTACKSSCAVNPNGNYNGYSAGYYGFSRPTADISYIYFDNRHIGARNLSYGGPAINAPSGVREVGTWLMMLLGFAAIGFSLERKKARRTAIA